MHSFRFGSVSGATFAFYFFTAVSLFIGYAVYRLLRYAHDRKPAFRPWAVAKPWQASLTGVFVSILIFLTVYFSSLNGFYRMDLEGDEVRLHYILPQRALVLRRAEIAEVTRAPSYKGLWRMVIYTQNGVKFESARDGYRQVRQAWIQLNQPMENQPPK